MGVREEVRAQAGGRSMIDRIVEELQTLKVDSELRDCAATVLVKWLVAERDEARRECLEARCLASHIADEREEANAYANDLARQRDRACDRAMEYAKWADQARGETAAARAALLGRARDCDALIGRVDSLERQCVELRVGRRAALADAEALRKVCAELHARNQTLVDALTVAVLG